MGKKVFTCIICLCIAFFCFSQQDTADIIVLLDNSGTMLPYFDTINDKILTDIASNFIRIGDTFHLISFSVKPNTEIAQQIKTEQDVQKIVSRFRLLYPLGQNSDFLSGLNYTQQYVNTLPAGTRKIVVIVSDGIFNPPASSPYASISSGEVESEILSMISRLKKDGAEVHFIRVPFPEGAVVKDLHGDIVYGQENSGNGTQKEYREFGSVLENSDAVTSNPLPGTSSATAGPDSPQLPDSPYGTSGTEGTTDAAPGQDDTSFIGRILALPTITYPEDLGRQFFTFALPLKISNETDGELKLQLSRILVDGQNVLDKTVFVTVPANGEADFSPKLKLPDSFEPGEQTISAQLVFSGNVRVQPQQLEFSVLLEPGLGFSGWITKLGPVIITVILILLAVILVIILAKLMGKISSNPQAMAVAEVQEQEKRSVLRKKERAAADVSAGRTQDTAGQPGKETHAGGQGVIDAVSRTAEAAVSGIAEAGTAAEQAVVSAFNAGIPTAEYTPAEKPAAPEPEQGQAAGETPVSKIKKETPYAPKPPLVKTGAGEAATMETFHEAIRRQKKETANALPETSKTAEGTFILAAAAKNEKSKKKFTPVIRPAQRVLNVPVHARTNTMIELFVYNQNTRIGRRNIHLVRPGTKLGIGGKHSSFLIFLVKFPANIAEIRYTGQSCDLAILKPEYFPYAETNIIRDCLEQNFTIRSDKGYEVTFCLKRYEDPVVRLNRMLLSADSLSSGKDEKK